MSNSHPKNKARIYEEARFFDNYASKHGVARLIEKNEYTRVLDLMSVEKGRNNDLVLSLGCGSGSFEEVLIERGFKVYGLDLSLKLLANCPFPVVMADCATLPFASGCSKKIFCFAVLHHLPQELYEKTLREIHRVLCPGGIFYAIEPKRNLMDYFSQPFCECLGLRTKTERHIILDKFTKVVRGVFSNSWVKVLPDLNYIAYSPMVKVINKAANTIFNSLPFTDKNKYFLMVASKK